MKRIAALCAALLGIVLFLAACAPQESAALDEPAPAPRAEGTRSALPFAVGRLYDLSWADYYSSLSGCSDGNAFYTLEQVSVTEDEAGTQQRGWLILRIDYETRTQAPLCSLPGCAHEDAGCPAFLCGIFSRERFTITVIEGQLYVLHNFEDDSGTEEQTTVWLDRAAMDGSGRQRVAQFPTGWLLDGSFPVTDGTALYGQYADLSDYSSHGVRVALETGEVSSFSFGLDGCEEMIGTLEGQFILRRSDDAILQTAYPTVMAPELYGVLTSKFGSSYIRSLLLYDPAAGTRISLNDSLARAGFSNLPYYTLIQQGKIYYITTYDYNVSQTIWQIDPLGGTARILAEFPPPSAGGWRTLDALQLYPSGPDTLEPYALGTYWDSQSNCFLLDVRDGSVLEIGLRYTTSANESFSSHPVAQTASGLWLVPVNSVYSVGPWSGERFAYALAAPETVLSGVGEVYPIQMWTLPEALG